MDDHERADYLASLDEAVAALDAGLYVSGADIAAWGQSLSTSNEIPPPPIRKRVRS